MPQNIDELLIAKCGECIFFDPSASGETGQCRRNAPNPSTYVMWPTVGSHQWCGEFVRAQLVVDGMMDGASLADVLATLGDDDTPLTIEEWTELFIDTTRRGIEMNRVLIKRKLAELEETDSDHAE